MKAESRNEQEKKKGGGEVVPVLVCPFPNPQNTLHYLQFEKTHGEWEVKTKEAHCTAPHRTRRLLSYLKVSPCCFQQD